MVRTRDFILFLLVVAFLLLSILGTELWRSWRTLPFMASFLEGSETGEVAYEASVPAPEDDRGSRLEILRAKVLARLGATTPTENESTPPVTKPTPTATTTPPKAAAVNTCASYQPLVVAWTPQQITAENREGAQVYFERGVPDPLSSTTPEIIRAVISLRSWPAGSPVCLPTDVIGIAVDGSLIRNDELALYTVFGENSLVGYSLDGFPIYGPSSVATDVCGGVVVGGQYRYVLDSERPGLISCFAASPSSLN